jgi:hypothetical protein
VDAPIWYVLFASILGEAALILFVSWLAIWLIITIPRRRRHQRLEGSYRAAWDVALPLGGLVSIVVAGRALLAWMIR